MRLTSFGVAASVARWLSVLLNSEVNTQQLYFENLDNDKQKELFMNEYWKSVPIR
jgi:hypothetical protein